MICKIFYAFRKMFQRKIEKAVKYLRKHYSTKKKETFYKNKT